MSTNNPIQILWQFIDRKFIDVNTKKQQISGKQFIKMARSNFGSSK